MGEQKTLSPGTGFGSGRIAFVALGSNLGDSTRIVRSAMARLQQLTDQPLVKSSLWETEPVDCPPGTRPFINAVVGIHASPTETPESLLAKLQQIEDEFGRLRTGARNEPRTLDLDLIAFGDETRQTPELTLPHPRAHLRRFVLEPLAEIAPELVLPGQILSVRELLARLPPAHCKRIEPTPT
ncbi:MAG: 2-amino-4-hydroxy-6-hydroxymethyldihydropteridine diphosphokinase [Verrucomicrobiae bacterium]|nr:2-amino-4-hydroxy-6-hydroxymethyldihydropteridine diphosphokinase [Verrucomicrobiae bacterium]MDW7979200.1 2-amino-4-hydroxy-6-hydroxymethyldihydropteridine diphosphokinase [Verrucomicrobiales bacterium]